MAVATDEEGKAQQNGTKERSEGQDRSGGPQVKQTTLLAGPIYIDRPREINI